MSRVGPKNYPCKKRGVSLQKHPMTDENKSTEEAALTQEFEEALDALGTTDQTFGPFADVIQRARSTKLDLVTVSSKSLGAVQSLLIENGLPVSELNGSPVHWNQGIASLCIPGSRGNVAEAAWVHSEFRIDLFRAWSELEMDPRFASHYDSELFPKKDTASGAYLAPSLPIPDRETISTTYIDKVLKPYAQAEYQLRGMFWEWLKQGHESLAWIGFRTTANDGYKPIPPGSGFDGNGSYQINRNAYLAGFELSENEVGKDNYPHRDPWPDQDSWLFIGADLVVDLVADLNSMHPALQSDKNRNIGERRGRGRPPNTGLGYIDDPVVEEGVQALKSKQFPSVSAAIRFLIDKYPHVLTTGEESTARRLRRKISQRLQALDV